MVGDALGQLFVLGGSLLVMLAGIGVVRFRDPLSRLHALTKASTLGVVLVFLGAATHMGRPNDWSSLLLASALQLMTSPISASLISRSTYVVEHANVEVLTPEDPGSDPGDGGSPT